MHPRCTPGARRNAVAALVSIALSLTLGCSGPQHAVMVRIENHQTQPPQTLGLISEGHPSYPDLADLPARTKPAPADLMEKVLELLDAQGFALHARPEPAWPEAVEQLPILRRLMVDVDGQTRSLTVPRAPDPALAACFSTLARAIGASFNEIEFLRPDRAAREGLGGSALVNPFESEQQRLQRENERKLRDKDR